MELGSLEHKKDFLYNLSKGSQENVWLNELGIQELENQLGSLRTRKAQADLKLDRVTDRVRPSDLRFSILSLPIDVA
jgi:hypothetical protein